MRRRLCLRIAGIPYVEKETEADCLEKCKHVFNDLNVNVPDNCLDRAHRIGKISEVEAVKKQAMIVHFTTWHHRTEVYRARKGNENYRIYLDLTSDRLKTLIAAKDMVEGMDNVDFVFADVNCRLTVKLKSGSFFKFDNLETLTDLVN